MKTVKKTSIFPASKKKVFSRLLKLKTLQYIAYPYATFTPMDGADSMSWEVGSTSRFKFRLFGVIPFGTHTIHGMFRHGTMRSFSKNYRETDADIRIKLI